MTPVELIVFLFLCFVIGRVGHLGPARWGWPTGGVPAFAVVIAMLFFEVRSIVRALLNAAPCRAGK
jgi:hypothetical protein